MAELPRRSYVSVAARPWLAELDRLAAAMDAVEARIDAICARIGWPW
jgi:hypothetical protein